MSDGSEQNGGQAAAAGGAQPAFSKELVVSKFNAVIKCIPEGLRNLDTSDAAAIATCAPFSADKPLVISVGRAAAFALDFDPPPGDAHEFANLIAAACEKHNIFLIGPVRRAAGLGGAGGGGDQPLGGMGPPAAG